MQAGKMIRSAILTGSILLLSVATCAQKSPEATFPLTSPETLGFSSAKLEQTRQQMQRYVDERKLPGLITLLARQGKVVHAKKYGMQDIENNRPMQFNTIFRLASMTKPLTSVAVMMLVEQGKLHLDDPASKFIPEFAYTKVYGAEGKLVPLARAITIKDLLTHTSGLAGMGKSPVMEMYRQAELGKVSSLAASVSRLATLPLAHQPGASWTYGLSTDVLARVVELISGIAFDRFLAQNIFAPLKMDDTGFSVPAKKRSRFAAMYAAQDGRRLKLIDAPDSSSYTQPPKFPRGVGGLVSTAADYLRFTQMLLNGGELEGARLLKRETVTLMMRNHLPERLNSLGGGPVEFTDNGFGLGFGVALPKQSTVETTNGFWWNRGAPPAGSCWWIGASNTYFGIDPTNGIIGIVLAQTTDVMRYPFMQEFHTLVYAALKTETPIHSTQ